jgi:hypothetical protein
MLAATEILYSCGEPDLFLMRTCQAISKKVRLDNEHERTDAIGYTEMVDCVTMAPIHPWKEELWSLENKWINMGRRDIFTCQPNFAGQRTRRGAMSASSNCRS